VHTAYTGRCALMHALVKPAQRAQPSRESDDSSIRVGGEGGLEPCFAGRSGQVGMLQQTTCMSLSLGMIDRRRSSRVI